MILPSKQLQPERALVSVGAELLARLKEPQTVSSLWDQMRRERGTGNSQPPIGYDWFILTLDLLFLMDAITFEQGVIKRRVP